MRYLSVCAGIEAASVAWHDLGWTPTAFSEIEKFPSAVLAHHYPNVPNWGDMTKFKEWPDANINVLVGGTPCQSFSVAGLRKGLDDPRGNLMLTFLAIADKYRPEWLVWENVPGVLSSNEGRDFGAFLGGLGELGYGFAYRVLDAQYFGVAQRRRRVFVVANARNWQRAAAVLFERASLCGDPAPSRKAGQDVAGTIAARFGNSRNNHEECVPATVGALTAGMGNNKMGAPEVDANLYIPETVGALTDGAHMGGGLNGQDAYTGRIIPCLSSGQANAELAWDKSPTLNCLHEAPIVGQPISFPWQMGGTIQMPIDEGITGALIKNQTYAVAFGGDTARSLTARYDSSPCADRGMDVVAVAYGVGESPDVAHCLRSGASRADKHESTTYVAQPVPYDFYQITAPVNRQNRAPGDPCHTLARDNAAHATIVQTMQVRRLTPRECERLQGFPDDYTLIPYRNKSASDGPRYKALGNSMAVPVMRWIGQRLQAMSEINQPERSPGSASSER